MHISTTTTQNELQDTQTEVSTPYLNVRPRGLKSWFVLFWVKIRVFTWWKSPKYIGTDLEERGKVYQLKTTKANRMIGGYSQINQQVSLYKHTDSTGRK